MINKEKILKDIPILLNKDLKIRDLNLKEIIPNNIDNVIVNIIEGRHILFLPNDMIKEKYKKWINGKGGVFSKDVHQYNIGNLKSKYILIKNDKESLICRLINDDELETFNSLKIIDGIIKDKPFTLIKKVNNDEKLSQTKRYINETNENSFMEEDHKTITPQYMSSQEDGANYSSHSLFNEE